MGKVAIVTGGNKGIGFGIVKGLAKVFDGDVFLTARNVERGMEAVKTLEQENIHVKFHQLDIDDPKSNAAIATFMKENYGGIDVLVNNAYAGVDMIFSNARKKFHEMDPVSAWDTINGVGLRNHFLCTTYASRLKIVLFFKSFT